MVLAVLILPVALVAFVSVLLRRPSVTVGIAEHAEVVRVARTTRGWRVVGLLAGLLVGGLLLVLGQGLDALGRVQALGPAAAGAGVLLGALVGELRARPAVGARRQALVETRRLRDVAPVRRVVSTALLGLVTAGFLLVGVAWGGPDDLGRPGRAFVQRCTEVLDGGGLASHVASRGPWPGSFYAVPLVAALLVVALLTALALRAVVARPRPPLDGLGLDTLLRRWSAGHVLSGAGLAVLGTLGPVALLVGAGLLDPGCPLSGAQTAVRTVALVVGPLAVVAAAGLLGSLLVTPTVRVDDLPRPLPGDAAPVGAPVR